MNTGFNHLRIALSVIFICFAQLAPAPAQAAVSLENTIRADDRLKIDTIAAMIAGEDDSLIIIDAERGTMTTIRDGQGATVALTGDGGAFGSDKVSGLARMDAERFIAANAGDDTAVIIDKDGKLIKKLASGGSREDGLSSPRGVAWSNNRRLYVADRGNNRISVFGTDGVFIQSIGQHGVKEDQKLVEPGHVYVDLQERVYVLQTERDGAVSVYKHDGVLIKRLSAADISRIVGSSVQLATLAVDDTGLIYLGDNNNGRVYQIDWQAGSLLASFGSKGEQRGQFRNITALAVLPGDKLAVADSGNKKIEIYQLPSSGRSTLEQLRLPTVGYEREIKLKCDKAYRLQGGNVLCLDDDKAATYTSSGRPVLTFTGKFSDLEAASVDDQDVVLLDDEKIRIYRLDGKQRYEAGASGSADGQLDSPRGLHLAKNKIYVADTGNRRIQIFTRDGIYLDKITNPENGEPVFIEPVRVVADSNDNLFVLEKEKKQVLVFSPERKLLYRIGGDKDSANGFSDIYDIAVDDDDNLYILCSVPGNATGIQVYNGPGKIISFGAANDQITGMKEPVALSIAPARKTVVSVYDEGKQSLLNYKYMQLPARVGGLAVSGTSSQSRLAWSKVPGSYVSRYKVYASREKQGPYKFITDVGDTHAVVEHNSAFPYQYYRVSAVSGFSVEGEKSNVREDAFQVGYAYYRDMKYDIAADIFSRSYEQDKNNGEVLKYLGLASMELGRTEQAVAYFRELAALPGYEVEGLNLQIRALVAVEDYVAARAIIDKVIADNTATIDTIVYCGELSLKLGDAIGAVTCLEEAIRRDDKNTTAHFLIGRAYIKLGITDKGLKEFEQAVAIDPDNAEVRYQSGLAWQEIGKHAEAIEQLSQVLKLDENHSRARLALARSHLALKHYDQVRNFAISLAGHKETEAEGQYLLGLTALASDQHGQALLALTKSTRADATNADAWLALADTYIKMGQPEKVRDALASAVANNSTSFDAAYRLGLLDYENEKYQQAAEALAIAVSLEPDHYDARIKAAEAQFRSGAYSEAADNVAAAARLKPDELAPLILQADIANKQGKNGQAIDLIKQAMAKNKNSAELHIKLGSYYVENSLFDKAKATLEKAALLDKTSAQPYVLLGALYSQRRLFDEAIDALERAVSLKSSAENKLALETAYAEKKKSMEFKSNAPQVVLKDLQLERVFSAAYKQYADKPVGKVRVQNTGAQDYGNLKLTFTIKGYMDFPSSIDIPVLKANSAEEYELFASFNNKILEIDEDTGVQAEVAINFVRDGRDDSISVTQPMTIYGKNAIVWGESNMVGSFVTPKDDTLRDFVRQAMNENKPEADAIQPALLTAMTLFDVFTAHGIKYVVDPNSPYSKVSESSVDYVQFGRETLKIKSGDCDDLSVLMSASLENLGVETAILDVPGHLLMMFNTGLAEADKGLISLDDDLMVIRDGTVWIPVEATMIGTSFAEAWAEGAGKYHEYAAKNELKVIALRDAWEEYKPVTLKPAGYALQSPATEQVSPMIEREKNMLLGKSLERLVMPYRAMVDVDPGNISARMQIAIIYAKNGLYQKANQMFDEILAVDPDNSAVYNNRGNIYFLRGDYERAIESYNYAEKLASNDPEIKMNLSMAHYQTGDMQLASTSYEQALMISDDIDDKYAGFVKLLSK